MIQGQQIKTLARFPKQGKLARGIYASGKICELAD